MSLSPEKIDAATPKDRVEGYLEASETMNRMIMSGLSFSGRERNCVYLNTRGPRFANLSGVSGLDFKDDGRAIGAVDWDFDGDLDLWISNRTGPRVRYMRNDMPEGNKFLRILLTGNGTTCNRDAIGARLELRVNGTTLLRTLRAGEGFQSQNSKWIHYGLGPKADIESLLVRWPDGTEQSFTDVKPDTFYKLTQGDAALTPWIPPGKAIKFEPTMIKQRPTSQKAHLVIGARVPLPRLTFTGMDGQQRHVREMLDKPLLLNLWATWCEPCVAELAQLNETDLNILALSVDGLDDTSPTTRDDARRFVEKHKYRFATGYANVRTVTMLQTYHNAMFMNARALPIPTSFLIDTNGNVGAIYKGPVSAERIREDIAHLGDSFDEHRARSIPFKGRWMRPAPNIKPIRIARRLVEDNMVEEGVAYFEQFGAQSNLLAQKELMEAMISKLRKRDRNDLADRIESLLKAMPALGNSPPPLPAPHQ